MEWNIVTTRMSYIGGTLTPTAKLKLHNTKTSTDTSYELIIRYLTTELQHHSYI